MAEGRSNARIAERLEVVVTARDVTGRYGEGDAAAHALGGVSIDIESGRLTAIMALQYE